MRRAHRVAIGVLAGAALLAIPTIAVATTSINIDGARVPGGQGRLIEVSLTYSCDAASGVTHINVHAFDATGNSNFGGVGSADATPTCDAAAHATKVRVMADHGTFRYGNKTHIEAAGLDSNGHLVAGARQAKDVIAG
jgi:hypothetical protein